MQMATDNQENARYNDEALFLDGIVDFHPEVYIALPNKDQRILQTYYLTGRPMPENIFDYRDELLRQYPGIDKQARAVLQKVLQALSISEFQYTTKPLDTSDDS